MSKRQKIIAFIIAVVLLIVMGIGVYLFMRFGRYTIPQAGMSPTISPGSTILVDRFAYSNISNIQFGDIVVFQDKQKQYIYIWRAVGLPGDHLIVDNGSLIRNDRPLYGDSVECPADIKASEYECFLETEGDFSYTVAMEILPLSNADLRINFGPVEIGNDEIFLLGDCRNCARDSRMTGSIKFDQVIGKANLQ